MSSKKLFFHHLCLRIPILPQAVFYTIKKLYIFYTYTHEISRLRVAININFKALILMQFKLKGCFWPSPDL